MTNTKELTRLLANVIKVASDHRETWVRCQMSYQEGNSVRVAMTMSILDYRRAVSRLFKAVLGRCPSQAELEAIDPAFEVRKDD